MAAQYFIKRGETVKGPFTIEKIQALKKAKKLNADDRVSQSAEGPWESLTYDFLYAMAKELHEENVPAHEKAKQSSEQPNPSPVDSPPKTVACEDCGGIIYNHDAHQCPHCGALFGQSGNSASSVAEDTDDEQFGANYMDLMKQDEVVRSFRGSRARSGSQRDEKEQKSIDRGQYSWHSSDFEEVLLEYDKVSATGGVFFILGGIILLVDVCLWANIIFMINSPLRKFDDPFPIVHASLAGGVFGAGFGSIATGCVIQMLIHITVATRVTAANSAREISES